MSVQLKVDDRDTGEVTQNVLGRDTERRDARQKVTGRATYAAEIRPEGLVHGALVRAPGMGRVELANRAEVEAMPGVLMVLSDARMIRNAAQGAAGEAPVQGVETAAYVGQPVALVVAESFEAAAHAARTLTVTCEGASNEIDPEKVEIAEDDTDETAQGDLEAALREARHEIDRTYTTPSMHSAAMEPHAALAEWDGARLTVRASLQMLRYNRAEIADCLGIDTENVRLLSPFVGGGFGSKLGISAEAVAAALAARELGRPVRVVQHRRSVFEVNTRRSETTQRIRLGADAEGRLDAIGHEALVSNLPEEDFSEPVLQGTHFAYAARNRLLVQRTARIHRPAAGSVRAPGEAVGITAFEIAMDELADEVGIDPVELRLANIPEKDPESDVPFSSHMLAETLHDGAARFGWADRPRAARQRREGEWWIGSGMAACFRVNMMMPAEARVRLTADGAIVETDMTDIGTGSYSILGQIAAEALGLTAEGVEVRLGDTDFPPGSGSGGSFGAASTGTAVWLACAEIRTALAGRMDCEPGELTLREGTVQCGNRSRPLAELLNGETLTGHGEVEPGKAEDKVRQATFGACFAEVAVSDVTGETRLRRMVGSFAAGRILNPRTARSQAQGGMIWGTGMALTEALLHDRRDGHVVNRDLAEYHLPVHADIPEMDIALLEESDPWAGPLHAKGIGELGICGSGAAVINAIHNACGVRVRDLPATPDRVLGGLS
ncbi:xanthine dehydrogenase family protein molybdopterin-binding subunit [Pseudooceanicola batsensis]|nr:xanthine dehydrogenase family protein molybdopterin-binding subunit [Pseudooceanicola batsensis]